MLLYFPHTCPAGIMRGLFSRFLQWSERSPQTSVSFTPWCRSPLELLTFQASPYWNSNNSSIAASFAASLLIPARISAPELRWPSLYSRVYLQHRAQQFAPGLQCFESCKKNGWFSVCPAFFLLSVWDDKFFAHDMPDQKSEVVYGFFISHYAGPKPLNFWFIMCRLWPMIFFFYF